MTSEHKSATRAVHAGEQRTPVSGIPTSMSIHPASAYFFESANDLDDAFADSSKGYVYSRYGTPNVSALETAIASLEQAESAIAFGSGMAALYSLIRHVAKPGQNIVASRDLYGATYSLLKSTFSEYGICSRFENILDLEAVEAAVVESSAVAIIAETASNPLIRVADIPRLADIAHRNGAVLIIDNTFVSPILAQPLTSGADYVVHSTTKYLAGHGDSTGGVIATSTENADKIRTLHKLTGAILSPFEAWLIHRSIKTLPLRMKQHCLNAEAVVNFLQKDARVDAVYYPGISQDVPDGVFATGMRGGMLAFEIRDAGRDQIFQFLDGLQMIMPAPTLGDVYTLTLYPAMASHRALTPEERASFGIRDNLVRLSVGIEDASDIIDDLDRALTAATS